MAVVRISPPVRTANHGTAEVAHERRPDRSLVPLALEQQGEGQQAAELDQSRAIDPTISRPARDLGLDEPRLPQDPLAEALEP